jgi:hypothetical protein
MARAMFSKRAAAGVPGPRMPAPWRAVWTSWAVDQALAIIACTRRRSVMRLYACRTASERRLIAH